MDFQSKNRGKSITSGQAYRIWVERCFLYFEASLGGENPLQGFVGLKHPMV
jgi:hypothetical protein